MTTTRMNGEEIQAMLRRRRLTQTDLAHAAGMTQASVSRTLAGYLPLTPEVKAKIEAALGELNVGTAPSYRPQPPIFDVPVSETGEQ
jgi:transcriptional regulator with XRE-family HTH domain